MTQAMAERFGLLLKQGRTKEAKSLIDTHLTNYPDDFFGRYCYAIVLFQEGEKDSSREITDQLLTEDPEADNVLRLSIEIDMDDDKLEKAESKANLLIEMQPEDTQSHLTMARIKMAQRSYDKSLEAVDKALELDAENVEALNLKILVGGILGNKATTETIHEALAIDAENPSSIANHGMNLMRQGKINEALERLKYALSLEPGNQLARYGMQEALKSRFWPYRLFYKYGEFSARLSEKGSWQFIIGAYVVYQVIRYLANNNPALEPFLMPIVYIIFTLFLLTWVMGPLMNVYLLTNKYGRVLLDKDDKTMALLCGGSVALGLVALAVYFGFNSFIAIVLAAVCLAFLIPLGSFLKPVKPANRNSTKIFTIGLVILGLGGAFAGDTLLVPFLIGLFIYQWYINGILIKENSRIFE